MSAPPWFPPGLPFCWAALWACFCFVISRGGWHAFAMRYPAPDRPPGRMYFPLNTSFSMLGHYGGGVRVIFADEGGRFSIMFVFRAFHPPFLVPCESVKEIKKKRFLFRTRYVLKIRDAAGGIDVILPVSIEKEFYRFEEKGLTPAR